MIQRLQTVLLFLAACVNATVLFAPFWYFGNNALRNPVEKTAFLSGSGITLQESSGLDLTQTPQALADHPLVMVHIALVCLSSLVMLAAIFLFKNRPLQMKVTYGALLMVLVQTVVIVLQSQQLGPLTGDVVDDQFDEGPKWGYLIPVLTLLLVWWANRRIRKDEKLVKSMDRLR